MPAPQPKDVVIWIGLTVFAGCAGAPAQRRAVPSYDDFSGRLIQLTADQNGDGQTDQWTYLDGTRPQRGEADTDGDGRIDRWEYFDIASALTRIGTSSRGDGVEDTWTDPTPSKDGESMVATSRRRDRVFDHREFFRGQVLVRIEDDTNSDGRIDKWERYEGSVLREAAFDTSFSHGRADRRALYDETGRFSHLEEDPDGDGAFVRVEGARSVPPAAPGAKQ
jgi:hypothetical protein